MNLTSVFPLPGRLLWMQKHTARLESHWMSMQRLMYLNDMSGPDMYWTLSRLAKSNRQQKRSSEGDTSALLKLISDAGGPVEQFHRSLGLLERSKALRLNSAWLGLSTDLRFCRLCLGHGVHSIIFQLPFVRRCPYHNIELQHTCPACGHALGVQALDHPFSTHKALHCNVCQGLFLEPDCPMHEVVAGYPEAEAAFRVAHLRVERLLQATITRSSISSLMEPSSPSTWNFCFHSVSKCTESERRASDWMKASDPHEVVLSKTTHLTESSKESEPESRDLLATIHHLSELTQILRAIEHQLHEKVRQICGHRHGADLDYGWHDLTTRSQQGHINMETGDCPCCACLSWWRAQVGVYFGLRDFLRERVELCRQTRNLSWIATGMPLEPERVARMSRALFAYQARSMLRLIQRQAEPSEEGERTTALQQGPGDHDAFDFSWARGPHPCLWRLNLWLGRLPDASMTVFHDTESYQASYSLHGAWRALGRSVEVQRKSLARSDRRLQWLEGRRSRAGYWYAAMALDHNRRFWCERLA